MNATEMPTTQDAAIEESLGRPLAVLYARAAASIADPAVQRVLELRSFLAVVEDQAGKARDRIHQATGPQGGLYDLSAQDLRVQTALLEAALETGRTYAQTLQELIQTRSAGMSPRRRPVQFAQPRIAALPAPDGGLTARPGTALEPAVEVGAGRHRR